MTHEMKGHYAKKHSPERSPRPEIAAALREVAQPEGVPCAVAHDIAARFEVPPLEIGFTLDTLEIPICNCQMGLFGYQPERRIVKPAENVSPELEAEIRSELQNGKLHCKEAWDIAKRLKIPRMAVSAACERLGVKIAGCQLGAF